MQIINLSELSRYINKDCLIFIDCSVKRCKIDIVADYSTKIATTKPIDIDEICKFIVNNKVDNYVICGDCEGMAHFIRKTSNTKKN